MDKSVRKVLDRVEDVADFAGVKLNHINDTNVFGDNALHCVCLWGDLEAAQILVKNGINIEQKGEGGFTPLKVADDFCKWDIVKYLISVGANTDALDTEFNFETAANSKHLENLKESIEELKKKIDSECK